MLIGSKQHTAGAKTRWRIDYREWLDDGRTLNQLSGFSATLSVPPALNDVTISGVTVTEDDLFFFVQGGSLNEAFTIALQVTDTLGEIVPDTINFTVVQP
jgi:hypothetical protein